MHALASLRPRTTRFTREVPPRPSPLSRHVVDCAVYLDGHRLPGSFDYEEALAEVRRRGDGFVWIGLHAPDVRQFQGLADTFELPALAVEDAVHARQRPKLDRYDDLLFMVLKTVNYVEHEDPATANEIVETGEVMVFLGPDFVVTVRHGNHSGLAEVRRRLERDPEQLALGPATVLHAIADQVVDRYLAVTSAVQDDIEAMESRVFAPHTSVTSEQIYLMKREILELRRAVRPLANPLRRLAETPTPMVPGDVRQYFRDVDDHLATVSERVSSYDELLTTLVDAALAKITVQQNSDMRRITAWVAIITLPMMIAGVYGMNFEYMPELQWRYGYYAVLALIAVACGSLYRGFRRNGWL
ncbi:MAG: magnesium/cobalt transporter CorA [Pseudonocardiaceae bacterium]|nr:magnesium/cobalt transporter CorA [Pseudonocardiaceae bacterium]